MTMATTTTITSVSAEVRPRKLLRKSGDQDERQRDFSPYFSGECTESSSIGSGHVKSDALDSQPRLTPREEELEWASVTPDEMKEIESDLKGMDLGISGGGKVKSEGKLPRCSFRPSDSEREELLLPAMKAEIDSLPEMDKKSYIEACRRCPAQVDDGHKKAFLFVENFDPKLAAQRLAKHWQYRQCLFGPDKCFLPMTLSGAMVDDINVLSKGACSLLPVKDAGGRSILYFRIGLMFHMYSTDCSAFREGLFRSLWYLLQIACKDPETRRRGIVIIGDAHGSSFSRLQKSTPSIQKQLFQVVRKIGPPILFRSLHICRPNPLFHLISPILKFIMGPVIRKRLIVHYGSSKSVRKSISEFGFDKSRLPLDLGGEVKLDMSKWVSSRIIQESQISETASVTACVGSSYLNVEVGHAYRNELKGNTVPFSTETLSQSQNVADNDPFKKEGSTIVAEPPLGNISLPEIITSNARNLHEAQSLPVIGSNDNILGEALVVKDQSLHLPTKGSSAPCIPAASPTTVTHAYTVRRTDTEPTSAEGMPPCGRKSSTIKQGRTKTKNSRDPRMEQAVEARMADPKMSLFDALVAGGFAFPPRPKGLTDQTFHDCEGISLHQRKNQLCRRLRDRRMEDPRIELAASAKMKNPDMSMMDALLAGGFQFPKVVSAEKKSIRDVDNVTLNSRLKQLTNKLANMSASGHATDARMAADERHKQPVSTDEMGSSKNRPCADLPDLDDKELPQHAPPSPGEELEPAIFDINEENLTDWDSDSLDDTTGLGNLDVGEMMKELSEWDETVR